MNDGKMDNQLNLALELPAQQREKSPELSVGYEPATNTWEVIVKYHGSLERIRQELNAQVTELLNEYAVIVIGEDKIERLSDYSEIEFIEKPKSMYFELKEAAAASCIPTVWNSPFELSGAGVLIAIIDSGIDYAHPDFRNADGTTRILYLWDQTGRMTETIEQTEENPMEEFNVEQTDANLQNTENDINSLTEQDNRESAIEVGSGVLYTSEDINRALEQRNRAEQLRIVNEIDTSGHGTHVAGIACGNGRASNGVNRGVAYESTIIIVKLGTSVGRSFPRTTQLMTAVDFVIRTAIKEQMPLSINISFGNNYGSHDGNSLLEQYLNSVANLWEISIVVGTGNEGGGRGHAAGRLPVPMRGTIIKPQVIELSVGAGETSLNVQLWKNYYDQFDIELIAPDGTSTNFLRQIPGKQEYRLGNTELAVFYGEPKPINRAQELLFVFLPMNRLLTSGIWQFILTPREIITGDYNFWLPTAGALSEATGFLNTTVETTLTIPSTANRIISVGAYDSKTDTYAYFSGRGYTRGNHFIKPELVAPGVDIVSAAPGGGYDTRTGTSMATPFVTGAAALLMEWGIVRGNDPYLYGEKLKAYLIKGARQLSGFNTFPNPQIGYGALCLRDSLLV